MTLRAVEEHVWPERDLFDAIVSFFFQSIYFAVETEKWWLVDIIYSSLVGLYKKSIEDSMIALLTFLYGLGVTMHRRQDTDQAKKFYSVARKILQEICRPDFDLIELCILSNITYGQARIAASSRNHTAALSTYQASLTHYQQAIASNPASASALQRDLALIQLGLADAHMGLQDWPAAEQALAKSVAIFRQLAAVPRAPRHAREDLAIALARQALLPPGDLAPLQEAEDLLQQLCAEFVEVPAYPRELNAVRELQSLVAVPSCYAD
jgi:tetratricopeptide (TPR) repeat protein